MGFVVARNLCSSFWRLCAVLSTQILAGPANAIIPAPSKPTTDRTTIADASMRGTRTSLEELDGGSQQHAEQHRSGDRDKQSCCEVEGEEDQ